MAVTSVLVAGLLTSVLYVLYRGYEQRTFINRLRKQGVVMPEGWSWIFGHLLAFGKYATALPSDANVLIGNAQVGIDMKKNIYVLDLWPMTQPALFIGDAGGASDIATKHNMPKADFVTSGIRRITGGPDILSLHGQEWKFWRSMFNPGFSLANVNAQTALIVDSVEIFCDILKEEARKGDISSLVPLTTRLTMEIIVKLSLGLDMGYQRRDHPLAQALRKLIAWNTFWDPRILYHPMRPLIHWYYGRQMNLIIADRLDYLFKSMRNSSDGSSTAADHGNSVASLALKSFIAETKNEDMLKSEHLDTRFAQHTTYQMRLFLFAGNDTTSSTICWVYHCLSQHPDPLAKLREEHNAILGSDPSHAATLIRQDPLVLNKLEYTLAVAKETLRVYPPAGSSRLGNKNVTVRDSEGNAFPTEHLGITIVDQIMHKDPSHWARPEEFLPERWVVGPEHELYPRNKEAYRPFEIGPRACIAQNLVYNELRIVLAMTIRSFEIQPAYEEWDKRKGDEGGLLGKMGLASGIKTVNGSRAYQVDDAGSHPSDEYPCRISVI